MCVWGGGGEALNIKFSGTFFRKAYGSPYFLPPFTLQADSQDHSISTMGGVERNAYPQAPTD